MDTTTEEKILEAAKIVFIKYGLYGARMQDIADTAGINKALLHYYFRNKEKLFDKIFGAALVKFFEQQDVLEDNTLGIRDRIIKYTEKLIDFYAEYPQMSMFIIKEIGNHPEIFRQKVAAAKKNRRFLFVALLEEGMKRGEIRKTDSAIFMISIQSLCSYPFLASPILKYSMKANGKEWGVDFTPAKLKATVRQFIEHTL